MAAPSAEAITGLRLGLNATSGLRADAAELPRSNAMKLILKILAALIGLAVLAALALAFLAYEPLPNEKDLTTLYETNAGAFEARTAEIREAVATSSSITKRRDEVLGYFAVEAHAQPFSVLYYTHSSGIGVGAYGTGLAYFEEPPEHVYANLEAMKPDAAAVEGFRGYGPIRDNWYYVFWEVD